MLTAITRQVSPSINQCEISFHDRQPIDVQKAIDQHRAYELLLAELGARVVPLPAEPDLPDAVFVEDPVVVVDEIAVICRMGAVSRRPEAASLADALSLYRPLEFLTEPATLDGGDVMRVGRTLFAGASSRTNADGIAQLRATLAQFDYVVQAVEVKGCVHLKSGCSYIGRNTILVNRALVDVMPFAGFELIDVPASEPGAANALLIEDTVIVPSAFPKTMAMLESRGFNARAIDVSEFQKAEGGVTCKSIIFDAGGLNADAFNAGGPDSSSGSV